MGTHSTNRHRQQAHALVFAVAALAGVLATLPADAQVRRTQLGAPAFVTPVQPPGPAAVGGLTGGPVPPTVAANDHDSCQWTNGNIAVCSTTICLEPLDEGGDVTCHEIQECYDHYGHQIPCP